MEMRPDVSHSAVNRSQQNNSALVLIVSYMATVFWKIIPDTNDSVSSEIIIIQSASLLQEAPTEYYNTDII